MLREVFAPSSLVRPGSPGRPSVTDVNAAFWVTLGLVLALDGLSFIRKVRFLRKTGAANEMPGHSNIRRWRMSVLE